ncbi:MAG: sterol carrier protein domain-containing protein, partial [Phycisphaerae bacterium]|nr:sterol carrier protein domain-containing protein [Phycisphaerae bacterium]
LPELKRRVKQRPPRRPGTLTIATDIGRTHLHVTRSGVEIKEKGGRSQNVLRLPQARLTQLVTGYRDLADLLLETEVKARGKAAEMAEILAPAKPPYFWLPDRF